MTPETAEDNPVPFQIGKSGITFSRKLFELFRQEPYPQSVKIRDRNFSGIPCYWVKDSKISRNSEKALPHGGGQLDHDESVPYEAVQIHESVEKTTNNFI